MPELSLDDDNADCDFDFLSDITGSSKSKQTSDQAKENLGYKTVQQYMANLSGIEAYRAMLDIVYTYDLLMDTFPDENYVSEMPMIKICNKTTIQPWSKANNRRQPPPPNVSARLATKMQDDNDDSNGTVATDTPTRRI
ncbi:hypothetical protein GQ42DRAFT_165087, partial [Ramicandelaber brevisporus]